MRRSIGYREPEPISALNTTPLIDVLLVLLIMLIVTIPAATHKLPRVRLRERGAVQSRWDALHP